jgi:enoyl-CoA hydratase/carnithine racemase
MPQSYIQAATQNGVLTLTIHRPEALNALNGEVSAN